MEKSQKLALADARSARWTILLCTCGALFGQFYAMDIPAVLNEQLKQMLMGPTGITEEGYAYYFSLLYTVYSVPNVLLPLAMGIAVDRCGYRKLIVLLTVFVVAGQLIFSLGISLASWPTMWLGRVCFGLGGESLQVAQNALLFRWFKGGELAFALGLNLSFGRAGSVLNDVVSPWLAAHAGVQGVLWFGAFLVCAGFACSVGCVLVDISASQRASLPESTSNEDEVSLSDIFTLPKSYWLLATLCVILYCAILPFNNIASAFFVETAFSDLPLAEAQLRAGRAMAMLFMVSAFCTPLFGSMVDRVGMRVHFLFASCILLTGCYHFIFHAGPTITMFGLGIVYTLFAGALWPAFALTVPETQLGTAYGVAVCLQNAGLAVVPLLVGHLQAVSGKGNFASIMQFFMVLGLAGSGVCVLLSREDSKSRGVLGLPSKEAEKLSSIGERTPLEAQGLSVDSKA